MAEPSRPFPPGDYPVVVVGSGPGGLQLSYCLSRRGIRHAILSADEGPGGMFRKWPHFQRLLSWTKPYSGEGPGSRSFERMDWNSLLADEPAAQSLAGRHMDGTSSFPSRAEMEANIADFAARTAATVRYGCRWTGTRREETPEGVRFVVKTTDGDYRAPVAVFAVGVAEPWNPHVPGIEHAHHYADVRPARTYAGKRVVIIGKRNSGFELATGLLPWAAAITLVSPSPALLSVVTKSLVGVRARYLQPFEDHVLGGGVGIVNGAIAGIAPHEGGFAVTVRMTETGNTMTLPADDVINATGFICPLIGLKELGVATFGQNALPAQTPWWESASVPGIYFAGTITQGSAGLSKNGIPPNSGAVHGHRYNARILARRLCETRFGKPAEQAAIGADTAVDFLVGEAATSPDLWHQKGYLARVVRISPEKGVRDGGIVPLTTFLDDAGADGVALALEGDGHGGIFPTAYVRRKGAVSEHQLPPHPMHDFSTAEHRAALAGALRPLGIGG